MKRFRSTEQSCKLDKPCSLILSILIFTNVVQVESRLNAAGAIAGGAVEAGVARGIARIAGPGHDVSLRVRIKKLRILQSDCRRANIRYF